VPKYENLEAKAFDHSGVPVTTLMLRNIPNKYTQNTLLLEIDDQGFVGSYDFFYLPMDVHNRSNVGYAFINFCTPQDAEGFRIKFSDHRFQRFQSRKISSVCAAHVQGLYENLQHFTNRAVTQARNSQYRPIVLKDNFRIDFEDALEELKTRSHTSMSQTRRATTMSPAMLTPSTKLAGQSEQVHQRFAPHSPSQCGLELAIRDLAAALQFGQMQRGAHQAAAMQGACFGKIAPPPGLTVDAPAYVPIPGYTQQTWSPSKLDLGYCSDASTRDYGSAFSRTVSEDV
jgi:hypothetical protein